ncbi:MAG: ATP-binding protein [Desulfobacterium sp.]
MQKVFIETARTQAFMEAARDITDTENGTPGLMMAWGIAGYGKTECARQYCIDSGSLYIKIDNGWTPRAMLQRICRTLNGMEPGIIDKAKDIIEEEFDNGNIPALVIDEASRLTINHIEHFRDIFDNTGTPTILVGEPNIYSRVVGHAPLKRRIRKYVEFGPATVEDTIIFGIKCFNIKLEPEAAILLHKMSAGNLGYLETYMYVLRKKTRKAGVNKATREMVEQIPSQVKEVTIIK